MRATLAELPGLHRGGTGQTLIERRLSTFALSSPPDIDLHWTDVGSPAAACWRRRPAVVECRIALRNQRYQMYGRLCEIANLFSYLDAAD
ncbi:hypothetical protein QTH90_07740 [Variovorax sp. J2P1-59]|uniref:hypothetical protein n=1 Tax=Variovorax flavidus TaxID=3053501 RepID=UPI0025751EB9|nr:hypothetical protein [Variovorax sp. J2P1-59]MDM0074266.1 hypothetical protein [Variovorax sp. J2P1-59]